MPFCLIATLLYANILKPNLKNTTFLQIKINFSFIFLIFSLSSPFSFKSTFLSPSLLPLMNPSRHRRRPLLLLCLLSFVASVLFVALEASSPRRFSLRVVAPSFQLPLSLPPLCRRVVSPSSVPLSVAISVGLVAST